MRVFTILFLIFYYGIVNASIFCGVPLGGYYHCADGSMTATCCGAKYGYYNFWYPYTGCTIFCTGCKGGCRKAKTLTQCLTQNERAYTNCYSSAMELGNPHETIDACNRTKNKSDSVCYFKWR